MNADLNRVGIISQVRMGSTRLPGKVLLPAANATLLDYHVRRLSQSGLPVVFATTNLPQDDVLVEFAVSRGLPYYRGSEGDVLARYYGAAAEFGFGTIVRVTSDCPLIDGALIRAAVDRYLADANPLEYRSNSIIRSYPRGFDFEIFSFELLREAHDRATLPFEREHVTPYIKTNPAAAGRVVVCDEVYAGGDYSHFRITLDTPEDYAVLRTLIEEYDAAKLDHPAIIALMEAHPEVTALNAHIEQKTT